MDGAGEAFEGGDGVGAHDLRADEDVDAVDQAGGEQGGVEAGAGFGEQGENAFAAEHVEDGAERYSAGFGGKDLDSDAAAGEVGDLLVVFGDGEEDDVEIGGAHELGVERHAQGGVEDDAQEGAATAEAAAVGEVGVVGEHGVDADHDGVGLPAERLHGARGRLRR